MKGGTSATRSTKYRPLSARQEGSTFPVGQSGWRRLAKEPEGTVARLWENGEIIQNSPTFLRFPSYFQSISHLFYTFPKIYFWQFLTISPFPSCPPFPPIPPPPQFPPFPQAPAAGRFGGGQCGSLVWWPPPDGWGMGGGGVPTVWAAALGGSGHTATGTRAAALGNDRADLRERHRRQSDGTCSAPPMYRSVVRIPPGPCVTAPTSVVAGGGGSPPNLRVWE